MFSSDGCKSKAYYIAYSMKAFDSFLLGLTPSKAEQPLRGMELQEKEVQKDYSIQESCLERT